MKIRATILSVISAFIFLKGSSQVNTFSTGASATPKIKYNIFDRPPLGQIQINIPQPAQFQPVTINSPGIQLLSQSSSGMVGQNFLEQQQQQILRQNNLLANPTNPQQVNQLAEVERDLMEEKMYREQIEWMNKTAFYRSAYNQLMQLNPDSFSISKAVFIVENAWLENKYSYADVQKRLTLEAKVIRQQLKAEKLNLKDNLVLNYGIQKRYKQLLYSYDSKTKQTRTVKPFGYDFNDFEGEHDYTKMFVTKMMITGKGQCHSMPLMYLMIAEQLDAKAWLSLAPQHSFIQFQDKNNRLLNFETTNGNLVSSNWLLQSGFINANALKEKTYLDTLSQRQLFAQCLADLLLGYMHKFGYDDYAEKIRQTITQINADNLTAIIIDANIKTQIALQKINAAGRPKEQDLKQFPEAYQAYLDMQAAYEKVDGRGFQDMPKDAYQAWLKTIGSEKKKQENKELQEKMRREIEMLKKLKITITDKTRD